MDKQHLEEILIENGFTDKESAVYIAALELGSAPISTIARRLKQHRVTVYSIVKSFVARGIAQTTTKNNTKHYSMIPPQQLVEKLSEKIKHLQGIIPDLMALASKVNTPVKAQFFEGLEGLKSVYKQLIMDGDASSPAEPFLAFVGSSAIDPALQIWFVQDFIPRRLTFKKKTQSIITKLDTAYAKYNYNKHNSIVIDNPIFDFANEIIVYGQDEIAILMYAPNEMAALIIQSKTLHTALKAMFHTIWNAYKPASSKTSRNQTTKPAKSPKKLQKKR